MTDQHVLLTRDVETVPDELKPPARRRHDCHRPFIPEGTRLILSRSPHGRRTLVDVYLASGGHVPLCTWIERHRPESNTVDIELLPTERRARELGGHTLEARRVRAERRLAGDILASISTPLHDFTVVMHHSNHRADKLLHWFYLNGRISLNDIESAIVAISADE